MKYPKTNKNMAKKQDNRSNNTPKQDWQWMPVEKYVDGKLRTVYVKARKVGYPQSHWEAVEYDANGNYRAYAKASDVKGVQNWIVNNSRAYDSPRVTSNNNLTRATTKNGEVRYVDLNKSKDFNGTTGYKYYDPLGNEGGYTRYEYDPSLAESTSDSTGTYERTIPSLVNEGVNIDFPTVNDYVPDGWHETMGVWFPDSYTREEEDDLLGMRYDPKDVQEYRIGEVQNNMYNGRIPTHGGGFTTQAYINKNPDAYSFEVDDPSVLGGKDPLFWLLAGGRGINNGAFTEAAQLGKSAYNFGKNKLIAGIGEEALVNTATDLGNIWSVLKYPVYTGFGIQGASNLGSEHGLRKTWDLGKKAVNEDWRYWFPTIASGFGDLLDASFMVPSTKLYGNLYRNLGNEAVNYGLETAAKYGNDYAKGWRVAREMDGAYDASKVDSSLAATRNSVGILNTEYPRITAENMAGKTTDSWEAAYSRALNSGNTEEAQRLMDLRWNNDTPKNKIKIGNSSLKLSHATDSNFNTFDSEYWNYGAVGKGNYFGPKGSNFSERPIVKNFYVNQEQPLFLNDAEREALFEDTTTMPEDILASGHDGVVVNYGKTPFSDFELVEYSPNRIKSADPVTHDNNGWTIPITERFHFGPQDVDIRGRGWFGESIALQNAQAMRLSSRIGEAKGIGKVNPQTRSVQSHVSLQNPKNPLLIRRKRLENKFIGDYDSSTQKLLNRPIVRVNEIRKAFLKLDPTLTDDELDLATQTAFASRRGVHIPIGDNSGLTIGGVSVVDIKETLKYLRESGIINPNAEDVGTVVAHEIGHGVKVNKAAMNLVKDYSNPNEFYTLVGQILDYGKVTKNEEISFNRLMKLTDKYLHDKKLDNGITELKEYLSNYPMSLRKDLMKAIGRFSAGLFGAYLIKNRNKNGKIL